MKRTTICRSSAVVVAFLAAGAPLAAQDTPAAPGRTHVVQQGETLWSLATQYLSDPLLWPTIYRLNTAVIEDPHWIFPGEQLRLDDSAPRVAAAPVPPGDEPAPVEPGPPADTGMVAPSVEAGELPPPPVTETAPTVFARRTRTGTGTLMGSRIGGPSYRALLPGEFYAAGFLTEGDVLPWAEVRGPVAGETLGTLTEVTRTAIYQTVDIRAPVPGAYQVGDSLLLVRVSRRVPDGWGNVVVPTGIAEVASVSGGATVQARLVQQFGRVLSGQSALPLEPFRSPGTEPQPVANGVTGSIITVRDEHPLPGQQDVVFIDLGREHGITPGDIFEVIREAEAGADVPPTPVATLQIVHTRRRSSSGMLLQIAGLGVKDGATVRLILKMPS